MSNLFRPAEWLLNWFGAGEGVAKVNSKSMNSMPAVWYALQKISGDIGKMPLEPRMAKPDFRGSDPMRSHPSYRLLRDEPNDFQTSDVFKEVVQSHALGWGNGRAAIIRDGVRPVELIPLLPDRSDTIIVQGEKYHITNPCEDDPLRWAAFREALLTEDEIRIPDDVIVLPDRDVLHIVGLSFDGVKGYSIGDVFKDALGVGMSGQKLMRTQMGKGFTGRVMLSDGGNVFGGVDGEKAAAAFLKQFRERYSAEQDGEVAGMLRKGMTAEVLSMSNADAQLIEQMRFSRQDVMLIFGLQHIPGDSSATSYNSLEQKKLDQLESTNDRWMTRWEMQCDAKLRMKAEKMAGRLFFKFNAGSRLRTDIGTTATVLSTLVRATIMNRNEAREKLDLNPVEGGDEFTNPAITGREDGTELDDQRSDAARAKLRELAAVEAKRLVDIANGVSNMADFEKGVRKFYDQFSATLTRNLGESLDVSGYVEARLESVWAIVKETKDSAAMRASIGKAVMDWPETGEEFLK